MKTKQIIEFTDGNFNDEVLLSDQPVLVDFWAPWCGPCQALGPTIEDLAEQNDGTVRIGKLNVDDNPTTAAGYAIRSIPTVLLIKGGEVIKTFVGAQHRSVYQQAIDEINAT